MYTPYAPMVSSPLNPSTPTSKARNGPPTTRGRTQVSPSERLLRKKAAEAWTTEIVYRQVVAYERQALATLTAKREEKTVSIPFAKALSVANMKKNTLNTLPERVDSEDDFQEKPVGFDYSWLDLSFLTPGRLVKSMRAIGLFSSWKRRRLWRERETA